MDSDQDCVHVLLHSGPKVRSPMSRPQRGSFGLTLDVGLWTLRRFEVDNTGKGISLEACPSDERPIDLRRGHQRIDIIGVDAPPIRESDRPARRPPPPRPPLLPRTGAD